MTFKKSGKQIFGVAFTEKEEAVIEREIERRAHEQEAKYLRSFTANIDAQLLWFLHKHEGHGKKRLLDDFKEFQGYLQELIDYYEMPETDASFLSAQKLKEMGVDVVALEEEARNENH